MATKIRVDISSGNGLLPDDSMPLPEPMLTYHQCVLWHSHEGKFRGNAQSIYI